MKVFILATVRKPELTAYTELVFKTLRIGFPNFEVEVHLNGARDEYETIAKIAEEAECWVKARTQITHHEWIAELLKTEKEPFWICDTDIVFYGSVESWSFTAPMAGALIPEFFDDFTKAITRSRLHTSLLYIHPAKLLNAYGAYKNRHPKTSYNPFGNPVHPICFPFNGQTYFYDTCSRLYHSIGGDAFTAEQKDAYFHFHFGTFSDLVLPKLVNGTEMTKMRQAVLDCPMLGWGQWRKQEEWFTAKQYIHDGQDVIPPIDPTDAKDARQWNIELCKGNESAMTFCDLWYRYVHAIDDLIDTLRDGRPRMSKDQMISIYFNAALLYNSEFYTANRTILFPIILHVTNTYRDSVAWEHSHQSHLRKMADVWRTCGNDMYTMVALLCGGEEHMRKMSMAIKERDWLGQHDVAGNPL